MKTLYASAEVFYHSQLIVLLFFINKIDICGSTKSDGTNSEFTENSDIDYGIVHIFHEKRPEGESTTDRPFFNFNERSRETTAEHGEQQQQQERATPKRRNCTNQVQIIDRLLNGTGYNKYRIPEENGVDVTIEFWLQAITSISEITNDFEMDIYINEMWLDPALNFEHMSPCKQNLTLSHQVLEKLWTPNSCFINSKVAQIHNSPFQNIFLMLYPNGTIWVNYRVRVKGPCAMDLTNFPMDIQMCHLIYESFNYNNQEVRMRWNSLNPTPVYPINTILLPDFNLVNIQAYLVVEPYPAGMWDELHVKLSFERRYVWYFMQAYVPTYLTIFISWVSFSLGSKAIPARTMLGVNALLAMIFQFGNIMRNLPRVSYVKAIDVWMLGAMFFIFCSLLELAIVGFKVREMPPPHPRNKRTPPAGLIKCKKRWEENGGGPLEKAEQQRRRNSADGAGRGEDLSPKFGGIRQSGERRFMLPMDGDFVVRLHQRTPPLRFRFFNLLSVPSQVQAESIDKVSRIAFPTMFALFNIVYWSYYGRKAAETSAELHSSGGMMIQ
ncbi:hypothetical protein niasHS_003651 [Heterodera schachtii]|uniref:Uncharacterized protein n=1 Tax=Heterodera schachtii TaxID=97005 RepID=A0ABD2KH41_HETSC